MRKVILGSVCSVDTETKSVYKGDELIHDGNNSEVFKIEIDNFSYRVNVDYCYILAMYEIYFPVEHRELYTNVVPVPIRLRKRNQRCDDKIDLLPIHETPVENEGFRMIPCYPRYEVNSEGVVRKISDKGIVKQKVCKVTGYVNVGVYNPRYSKYVVVGVHRLTAFAWKYNPDYTVANQVNHKDGDKLNNGEDNVEWCTQSENIQHALDNELQDGKRYLLKDLDSGKIYGPMFSKTMVTKFKFNPGEISQWMIRQTRTKPFKNKWDIIYEGCEWEVKMNGPLQVQGEHAHKGVQTKDVEKWRKGEEGWLQNHPGQKEAAKFIGGDQGRISRLLSQGFFNQQYNGYCVRPTSDEPWDEEPTIPHGQPRKIRIIYDDGREIVYDSLKEAAETLGITGGSLGRRTMRNTHCDGYRSEYV